MYAVSPTLNMFEKFALVVTNFKGDFKVGKTLS